MTNKLRLRIALNALQRISTFPVHPCDDARNAAVLTVAIEVAKTALSLALKGV